MKTVGFIVAILISFSIIPGECESGEPNGIAGTYEFTMREGPVTRYPEKETRTNSVTGNSDELLVKGYLVIFSSTIGKDKISYLIREWRKQGLCSDLRDCKDYQVRWGRYEENGRNGQPTACYSFEKATEKKKSIILTTPKGTTSLQQSEDSKYYKLRLYWSMDASSIVEGEFTEGVFKGICASAHVGTMSSDKVTARRIGVPDIKYCIK